jgi:hypothetical protein
MKIALKKKSMDNVESFVKSAMNQICKPLESFFIIATYFNRISLSSGHTFQHKFTYYNYTAFLVPLHKKFIFY